MTETNEIEIRYPKVWEDVYKADALVPPWRAGFEGEFDGMSGSTRPGTLDLFAQYALMYLLRTREGIRSLTWYNIGNVSPKSKNRERSDRMWAVMKQWMGADRFARLQKALLDAGFSHELRGEPDLFCWDPATGAWFFAEAKKDDELGEHQLRWFDICREVTGTEVQVYRLAPEG